MKFYFAPHSLHIPLNTLYLPQNGHLPPFPPFPSFGGDTHFVAAFITFSLNAFYKESQFSTFWTFLTGHIFPFILISRHCIIKVQYF